MGGAAPPRPARPRRDRRRGRPRPRRTRCPGSPPGRRRRRRTAGSRGGRGEGQIELPDAPRPSSTVGWSSPTRPASVRAARPGCSSGCSSAPTWPPRAATVGAPRRRPSRGRTRLDAGDRPLLRQLRPPAGRPARSRRGRRVACPLLEVAPARAGSTRPAGACAARPARRDHVPRVAPSRRFRADGARRVYLVRSRGHERVLDPAAAGAERREAPDHLGAREGERHVGKPEARDLLDQVDLARHVAGSPRRERRRAVLALEPEALEDLRAARSAPPRAR